MRKAAVLFRIILVGLMFFISQTSGVAQCNAFAKKKCLPSLSPFKHNGQLNSTSLAQGESAELSMTFYSGQNYKLLVCNQPGLEGVYFKLKDADHKELYSSKDKGESFEFNVKSTQQLYVEVIAPEGKKLAGEITPSGCVSILVGFK